MGFIYYNVDTILVLDCSSVKILIVCPGIMFVIKTLIVLKKMMRLAVTTIFPLALECLGVIGQCVFHNFRCVTELFIVHMQMMRECVIRFAQKDAIAMDLCGSVKIHMMC